MPTPKSRKITFFFTLRNSYLDMIIFPKWVFWSLGQRFDLAQPHRVNPELCLLSLLSLDGNIYIYFCLYFGHALSGRLDLNSQTRDQTQVPCIGGRHQMATPSSPEMNNPF